MNRPRTSAEWRDLYARNQAAEPQLPWDPASAELSAAESWAIGESLAAWQLGETSDGAHLLAAARRHAERTADDALPGAYGWFVAEEQRHGGMLGRFLDLAGLSRLRRNWGDSLFRTLRYARPNLELWTTPVIMVESMALIYYRAVRDATRSPLLRGICEQILRDEVEHIRFQCERLASIWRHRTRWARQLTMAGHRALFLAVCCAVWVGHHRPFRASGLDFAAYWRSAWRKMGQAWRRMDPDRYDWTATPSPSPGLPAPVLEYDRPGTARRATHDEIIVQKPAHRFAPGHPRPGRLR